MAFHPPFDYKPLEQDYRFWLVVNPSTWLMPILFAVLLIALVVHNYAINLPGRGFAKPSRPGRRSGSRCSPGPGWLIVPALCGSAAPLIES